MSLLAQAKQANYQTNQLVSCQGKNAIVSRFSLMLNISLLMFSLLFAGSAFAQARENPRLSAPVGEAIQKDNFYPRVKFETTMGDIVIELNRAKAPLTTNNFLSYVQQKEYDNTLFNRIIQDYIVQGGGYDLDYKEKESYFKIINESGNGLKNEMYTIAMARMNDPHSAKRQFFFNVKDNDNLDPGRQWGYAVFGLVMEGQEVIDAMSEVETDIDQGTGYPDTPVEDVVLKRATILPEPTYD